MQISVKILTNDLVIAKFKYLTGVCGKILVTVMLIYRQWAIMAYSENLSDIIALGKCEVHYTNK